MGAWSRLDRRRTVLAMTRQRQRPLLALVLTVVAAAPAAAEAGTTFRSPSGNIMCVIDRALGASPGVRCDVRQYTGALDRSQGDCPESGPAYVAMQLMRNQRQRPRAPICPTDAVGSSDARVLPYGSAIRRFGIRCVSRANGITCKNRRGRGFRVSREVIVRF